MTKPPCLIYLHQDKEGETEDKPQTDCLTEGTLKHTIFFVCSKSGFFVIHIEYESSVKTQRENVVNPSNLAEQFKRLVFCNEEIVTPLLLCYSSEDEITAHAAHPDINML